MQANMEPSKLAVALFFALALLAASLQPSEAIRAQGVLNPAADDQRANADVVHPLTWPGFPNIPGFPPLPPLPPHPGCPPLPPIPGLPMPQIPGFPIPAVNPLPQPQSPPPPTPTPVQIPPPLTPPPVLPTPPPSTPLTPAPAASTPPPSTPLTPPPAPSTPPPPPPPLQSGSPIPPPPPSPSQPKECLPSLMGLNPCMGYLTNTSVSSPPAECCAGFKSLVDTAPICLCHGLNGDINTLMPAPMDSMRMMSLPGSCNVPLPLQALAQCSSPNVPPLRAPAPAAPPSPKSSP